ncbi:MAG: hypothetical protein M1820_008206 [Bogoriella megaspora]|nr:MAG: hypothetical protein M1820_008206 [Bogoriella megaspora]
MNEIPFYPHRSERSEQTRNFLPDIPYVPREERMRNLEAHASRVLAECGPIIGWDDDSDDDLGGASSSDDDCASDDNDESTNDGDDDETEFLEAEEPVSDDDYGDHSENEDEGREGQAEDSSAEAKLVKENSPVDGRVPLKKRLRSEDLDDGYDQYGGKPSKPKRGRLCIKSCPGDPSLDDSNEGIGAT